ncbi:hypothetical protein HZ326_6282 [Fusarium oxysporum f. sp. albedinis]|nr:hypothetical protein HZ326_6282 [Fusarium oxysporum f. sp. albedinis]
MFLGHGRELLRHSRRWWCAQEQQLKSQSKHESLADRIANVVGDDEGQHAHENLKRSHGRNCLASYLTTLHLILYARIFIKGTKTKTCSRLLHYENENMEISVMQLGRKELNQTKPTTSKQHWLPENVYSTAMLMVNEFNDEISRCFSSQEQVTGVYLMHWMSRGTTNTLSMICWVQSS